MCFLKRRALELFMQSNSLFQKKMATLKGRDTSAEQRLNIQIPTDPKISHSLSEVSSRVTQSVVI